MSSLATKRVVATALAGAAIASAIGATPASAAPVEPFMPGASGNSVDSPRVPPPPSSIAAPAGRAYEELRAPDRPAAQPTTEPRAVADGPSGFDLPSAAIGAATGAGLIMVLLTGGALVRRRPLTRRDGTIGA
jgi:hypothetical protein